MRHAIVGTAVAATLLLSLAGSAAAQSTPPKPADKKGAPPATKPPEKAPPPKAPEKAPSPPGTPFMEWDRLTGDWGGARTKLFDKGFDINARLTDDLTRVQGGGADPYTGANRYWFDLNLTMDLGKIFKCPCGGTLFASFWQMGGENGTKDFGSFNAISSIDSEYRQELAELYFADRFLKDHFDTRIGKMDVTERFNHSDYAGDFMNNAANYPATFFPAPHYPETAVGFDLFYRTGGFYFGGGLFDGSKQEGIETGHGGASHFFGDPGDLFLVGESGYHWNDGVRPVRVALGAWGHSGDFPGVSGHVFNRALGWYALSEGMLYRKNREDPKDMRGAYLVMRYGHQEPDSTIIDWTTTAALVWKGTFASRKNDSIGLAWSVASVTSQDPGVYRYATEQVVELYYKAQITKFFSIAPGAQYVANPGATYGDAVVFGVRAVVDF